MIWAALECEDSPANRNQASPRCGFNHHEPTSSLGLLLWPCETNLHRLPKEAASLSTPLILSIADQAQ